MRAVITGGASGIGREVARLFASDPRRLEVRAGRDQVACEILLVDRDAEGLDRLATELRSNGATVATLTMDLAATDVGDHVEATVAATMSGLDVLVSNAGMLSTAPLANLPVAEFDAIFAVNTRATWLLAKALRQRLAAARGCIVATASVSAEEPTPPFGAYSASKAALVMLVRQLAHEWGPDGIRCNCVSPGTVHTAMTDAVYADEQARARRASLIPLRRVADPQDIARVIAFLAGPDASYVSGVNVAVDGGLQTGLMPIVRQMST